MHEQDESLVVDSLSKTFRCSHDALRAKFQETLGI